MATGSPVFLPKQQPIPPRKQAARQPLRALPLPLYAQRSRRPPAQRQKQLPSPTLRHLLVPVRIAAEMEKCPAVAAIAAGMEISSVTVPTAAETANAIASPATAKDTMTAPAAAEMASAAAGAATAPVKTGRMTAATAAAETAKSSVPAAAVAETNAAARAPAPVTDAVHPVPAAAPPSPAVVPAQDPGAGKPPAPPAAAAAAFPDNPHTQNETFCGGLIF